MLLNLFLFCRSIENQTQPGMMASAVANMEEGGNYDSFTGPQESIFGYEPI